MFKLIEEEVELDVDAGEETNNEMDEYNHAEEPDDRLRKHTKEREGATKHISHPTTPLLPHKHKLKLTDSNS